MPRAILALRRYPAAMLLAVLLFAASLILAATSMGTVNGGGEGDDGGSGIGGTGKSGEFGGSGFGGTGGPSPFFTSAVEADDRTDQTQTPASKGVDTPLADTQAIAETVLTELTNTLEANVAIEPEQAQVAPVTPVATQPVVQVEVAQAPVIDRPAAPEPAIPQVQPLPSHTADVVVLSEPELVTSPLSQPVVEVADAPSATPAQQELALTAEVSQLAETVNVQVEAVTVAQESDKDVPTETLDRASVPERIQRPDLPPFQRIRPVERPSLLPSRVQPMRI